MRLFKYTLFFTVMQYLSNHMNVLESLLALLDIYVRCCNKEHIYKKSEIVRILVLSLCMSVICKSIYDANVWSVCAIMKYDRYGNVVFICSWIVMWKGMYGKRLSLLYNDECCEQITLFLAAVLPLPTRTWDV